MIWIVTAAIIAFFITLCIWDTKRIHQSYDITPQPNITDEEFCELMPNVPSEIALKVREVMVDVSGWEREEIHPNTRIIEFKLW